MTPKRQQHQQSGDGHQRPVERRHQLLPPAPQRWTGRSRGSLGVSFHGILVGRGSSWQTDGDVAGSLMAVDPRSEVDVMIGTGGTPEGVLAACAIKGMGGQILARLDPQSYVEKEAITEAGIDVREVLTVHDLVRSDDCFFAATGISGGDFLRGVRYSAKHAVTHLLVLRGKTGTLR